MLFKLSFEIIQHIISINIVLYVGMVLFSKFKLETILALYNPFDPFFSFFQFFSYMFIHSIHLSLHITFNMFILWILGVHINLIYGHLKFIVIYFSSGVTVGLLQNILKTFLIYHKTGVFDFYQISHGTIYSNNIQNIYLQYYMYSPIIGASGAIASLVSSFITIKFLLKMKIFIINMLLYNVIVILTIFPGISHLSHLIGTISGYYISSI